MFNNISFLTGLLIGGIFVYLVIKFLPRVVHGIWSLANLMRNYVVFSVLIIVVSIILHIYNFTINPFNNKELTADLISFYSGLVFAVLAGYYGFQQSQFSRFQQLLEDAEERLKAGDLRRAEILYKEAFSIKKNDFTVVGNLAELAVIFGEEKLFAELLSCLEKLSVEEDEEVIPYYLRIARALLKQEVGVAKSELKKLLAYTEGNPRSLRKFGWRFDELEKSVAYAAVTGESLTIFSSLFKYLKSKMEPPEKEQFLKNYS